METKKHHFCTIPLRLLNRPSGNCLQCSAHIVSSYLISLDPGQRICRRGTERPCYKVSYIQDSRRRLTFEDARQACRSDGGELLSIETEGEQHLIERFIAQLRAGDGDFWIGLRRSPQRHKPGSTTPGCPSQYYWLDGSKAKFRYLSSSVFFVQCYVSWLPRLNMALAWCSSVNISYFLSFWKVGIQIQISVFWNDWALWIYLLQELALGRAVMWWRDVRRSVLPTVRTTWRRGSFPVSVERRQLQLQEQLCLQIPRGWGSEWESRCVQCCDCWQTIQTLSSCIRDNYTTKNNTKQVLKTISCRSKDDTEMQSYTYTNIHTV